MTTTSNQAAQTPLYDLIVQQQARMTEFAGWEMPVQFSGLKPEHAAVREAAGLHRRDGPGGKRRGHRASRCR